MKTILHRISVRNVRKVQSMGLLLFVGSLIVAQTPQVAAQTCSTTTTPPTTYGQVTQTVNIATAGKYRVWSRIKAPDAQNNSFYLQKDGGCAIVVGNATTGITAGNWTWVSYQNGSTASHIDLDFTVGSHVLKYTGKEPNVQLDRVLLLSNLTCVPDNATKGDNCANPVTTPTVTITAPANNAQIQQGAPVNITTTAAPTVVKVNFLVDGNQFGTDTSAPFSYNWNTSTLAAGQHILTTTGFDTAGVGTPSAPVTITILGGQPGGDQTPPTISVAASSTAVQVNTAVTLTATAHDNVAVTKVEFYRDGTLLGTADTTAPYSTSFTPTAAGVKTITAIAYDAAGHHTESTPVSITATPVGGLVGDIGGNNDGSTDGKVNGGDYSIVVGHLGQKFAPANIDKSTDGVVSAGDLAVLLQHWTW